LIAPPPPQLNGTYTISNYINPPNREASNCYPYSFVLSNSDSPPTKQGNSWIYSIDISMAWPGSMTCYNIYYQQGYMSGSLNVSEG